MKFLILALFAVAAMADVSHLNTDGAAPIVKQTSDVGPDGSYQWSYETGNGIVAQEQGALKNAGVPDAEVQSAQGSASWTAPDGSPVQFSYVADENGFQPQGAHIHPVPEYILRSIEYNKAHPEQEV